MPGTEGPGIFVDGTARECTGIIAALEGAMAGLKDGTVVRALVADVPSRIEVLAWAERKGHSVPGDRREAGHFHLTIVKAGRRSSSPAT
jgi:TusA-related sulfurtransferase